MEKIKKKKEDERKPKDLVEISLILKAFYLHEFRFDSWDIYY